MARRAIEVIRVSKVNGRKNDAATGERFRSPEDQQKVTRDLARRHGAKIVGTFADLDESGGTMDRPGLNGAIDALREGKADTILVSRLDRFARNTVGAIATLELIEDLGGSLICGDLNVDTSDPMGRFIFTNGAAMAQLDRDRKGKELRENARAATLEGKRISPAPPGYLLTPARRLVPDPARAHLIPQLFERRAEGESWAALRRWWLAETGEALRSNRFRRMIENRTYLGELSYGDVVSPVKHTALVDADLFRRAQTAVVVRPARSKRPKALLAGIVCCASCEGHMTPSQSGHGVAMYRCQTDRDICPAPVAVTQAHIDAYVEEQFLAWAGDITAVTTGEQDSDLLVADRAVSEAEAALDRFMDAFADSVGVERARKRSARLQANVDAALAAREALERENVAAGAAYVVREHWPTLDLEDKRRLLRAGIEQVLVQRLPVTVAGGRQLVPIGERVSIRWRD